MRSGKAAHEGPGGWGRAGMQGNLSQAASDGLFSFYVRFIDLLFVFICFVFVSF